MSALQEALLYLAQLDAAQRRIYGGLMAFAAFAIVGLQLIWKGINDDRYWLLGDAKAGRAWYFIGGALLIAPLVVFIWFCRRQGVL